MNILSAAGLKIRNTSLYRYEKQITKMFDEETGKYTGDMSFTSYAVNGGDRTTDQVDVNVQNGKDNIFGNPTKKSTATTTTSSDNAQ